MGKDSNTIRIKVETGQEEKEKKESSSGGGNTGQNQQAMPVQNVVPDALGYAEQRAAAATGAAYAIPNGAPGVDLTNPVSPGNHPEVDLMNPKPAENKAVSASKDALGRQISTPVQEKTPFERGYEEQGQMDAWAELIRQGVAQRDQAQAELNTAVAEDETQQRNERSRKVIAGMGDAISSIVNLVGTMNGAYDQKQVFMEPRLRDAIEQDRQRRYAKIERLRANVQQQINTVNALKGAAERQRLAEENARRQADLKRAELQMKAANGERDYNLKAWKAQTDAEIKREQNEATNALRQQQIDEQNRHNRADEAQGWARTNSYVERNRNLNEKGGSGGGRSSGRWYDMNNFNEFQDEIARSIVVDGKRFSSWDELMADPSAARKSSARAMISELAQANTSDKQRAAVQKYIDHAPSWKGKYWGQDVAEYDEPEEESAPWLSDEEEDKDKAPWL